MSQSPYAHLLLSEPADRPIWRDSSNINNTALEVDVLALVDRPQAQALAAQLLQAAKGAYRQMFASDFDPASPAAPARTLDAHHAQSNCRTFFALWQQITQS